MKESTLVIQTSSSFTEISDLLASLNNPTGAGKRYVRFKHITTNKISFVRNRKGDSSHIIWLKSLENSIELGVRFYNYKKHLQISCLIVFVSACLFRMLSDNWFVFFMVFSMATFLFILSLFSDKRTESWFNSEITFLKSKINKI